MKHRRKLGAFLAVLFIITLVLPIITVMADDPLINMSLSAPQTDFLTGQEGIVSVTIDMSSATESYSSPTVTVTFPSEYVGAVSASDMQGQTSKTIVNDGTNWVVTYTFNQIAGGTYLSIPILIDGRFAITPDGYQLPINAVLADSAGDQLRAADEFLLTYHVRDIGHTKQIYIPELRTNNYRYEDEHTTFGGLPDSSDPTILSSNLDELVNIIFRHQVYFESEPGINWNDGVREMETINITDTLPPGAYFDPAVNPGWTDNGDGTVTYVYSANPNFFPTDGNFGPILRLKFPGAAVETLMQNSSEIECIPRDEQAYEKEFTAADDITFSLYNDSFPEGVVSKYCSGSMLDKLESKLEPITWHLYVINNLDVNFENFVMEDYDLDSRLRYLSINCETADENFSGTFSIQATNDGSTWTTVASNIDPLDRTEYSLPEDSVRIRMVGDSGSYVLPFGGMVRFGIKASMRDPENTHTDVNSRMYNTVSYSGNYEFSPETVSGSYTTFSWFAPYGPVFNLTKTADTSTCLVGDEVRYQTRLYTRGLVSPEYVSIQFIYDLLPPGMEYIPGSTVFHKNALASNDDILVSLDPEVVENVLDSGRTGLIWQFKRPYEYLPNSGGLELVDLYYKVLVTKDMEEGVNTNEVYMAWDNNGYGDPEDQVIVWGGGYGGTFGPDVLDLDIDGNTEEPVLFDTADITFVPPLEVIAKKYVQGMFDDDLINTGGRTEIGEWAQYQLEATNHSAVSYDDLTVLDVLPYVGDTTIVSDTNGDYLDRGSEFPVLLTGPATAPAGFTIYYTTDFPTDTTNKAYDYATDANWVLTPADYSQVIGIKFVMDEGETFEVDETCLFGLPLAVSDADPTLRSEQLAVNTFALSTNGVNFLEALNTNLRVVSYEIEGTAFEDANEDGIMDTGEAPIEGVRVWLTDDEGNAVSNVLGEPYVTTTDANGYYHFDIQRTGNYIVSFDEPTNYALTPVTEDPSELQGSHVIQGGESTDTFFLGIESYVQEWKQVRNAGYFRDAGSLEISKELLDVNGSEITEKRTFNFEVSVDGALYNGPAYINGTEVTIADGALSIENGDDVWIHEILLDDTYSVTELGAENYVVLPVSKSVSGTMDLDGELAEFKNTETPGTIGDSVWIDMDADGVKDAEETGIEGVTVELIDEYGNVVDTTVTDADGLYLFTDVPPGTYNVVVTPPDIYVQTFEKDGSFDGDTEVVMTTGADILDVDFGYQPLATIGSTVWVDTNGNGVKGSDEDGIEGVVVNLLDDSGTVVGTTITDANGQYIFENVPAGTYNIVITPPDNYYQTYELDGVLDGDTQVTVSPGEEKLDVNFGFQNKDVFNPKERVANPQTGDFEIPLWVWLSLTGLLLGAIAAGVVLLRKYMARSILV